MFITIGTQNVIKRVTVRLLFQGMPLDDSCSVSNNRF